VTPEWIILVLNLGIVAIAYGWVYPRVAGNDGNKIALNDVMASLVSLLIAGILFWDSGQRFNALLFDLNWFWFTLLTYALIEIPFMLWYFNKHDVWQSFFDE